MEQEAFTLQHPPIQRVADVSERIEDLCDIPDADLARLPGDSATSRAPS